GLNVTGREGPREDGHNEESALVHAAKLSRGQTGGKAVRLRPLRPVVPITLALAIAMTPGTPARADEAAEHFALAVSAEKRQDWQAAIDEYAKAYAIKPHPSVLYNIARNYERLEDWGDAAEYFKRYLAASPDADDRAKVEQRIVELEGKAKAARPPPRVGTGWLVVMADVDGA